MTNQEKIELAKIEPNNPYKFQRVITKREFLFNSIYPSIVETEQTTTSSVIETELVLPTGTYDKNTHYHIYCAKRCQVHVDYLITILK